MITFKTHNRRLIYPTRRSTVLALLAGTSLAAVAPAQGVIRHWANAAGGNSNVAANWASGLPNNLDSPSFQLASTYPVNWVAGSPSVSDVLSVGGGSNVTLSYSQPHLVNSFLGICFGSAGVSSYTLTTGTLTVESLFVGELSGATNSGTLHINDQDADLLVNGGFIFGNSCNGAINITNGGLLSASGTIRNNQFPASLTISGVHAGTATRSTLRTTASGDLVGVSATNVTFDVTNGALVEVAGRMGIGAASTAGLCTLTIANASQGFDATVNVASDTYIGRNTATTIPGDGIITLNSGASMTVGGRTFVGALGGTGVLNVNDGLLSTRGITVAASGTFNHTGGHVIIRDGFLPRYSAGQYAVGGLGGSPRLTITDGGQWTVPAATNVVIASANGAYLHLDQNAGLNLTSGSVFVGGASQRGTLTLGPEVDVIIGGALIAGGTNTSVLLEGGAFASAHSIEASSGGLSNLSFTVTGTGTTLSTSGEVDFGLANSLAGAGGVAVIVADGALLESSFVNASGPSIAFRRQGTAPGGSLTLSDATITAADTIVHNNAVTPIHISNGTINAPILDITNSDMFASGNINASLQSMSGATDITVTGPLQIGPSSGIGFVHSLGQTFTVGPHAVTIRANQVSEIGQNISLAGGGITAAAPAGIEIASSSVLSGFGIINADITNDGMITPTGAGLTFLRNLSDNGQGVSGTRLTFGNGSSYSGDGHLGCEVITHPGSIITPSGVLLMGNPLSVNGVSIGGTLDIGSHTVELRDFNGTQVSGTVNIAGGTMFNPSRVRFEGGPLPQLNGAGTVVGDCFMDGFISPGIATGDQTGHLAFDTLTFGTFSMLLIDIEGDQPGTFDTIGTVDDLDLNGTTLSVNRLGNYFPPRGTRYRIATGSLFGSEFSTVSAPGFHIEYDIGGVDLVFDKLCDSLDFNNDDSIFDPQDIDAFLSVFSEGPCIPEENTCNDIDFNNDGSVFDPIDIDSFLSMFSEGPCL